LEKRNDFGVLLLDGLDGFVRVIRRTVFPNLKKIRIQQCASYGWPRCASFRQCVAIDSLFHCCWLLVPIVASAADLCRPCRA
jgi:hypothetical protein